MTFIRFSIFTPNEIPAAFDNLKLEIPVEANNVVQWFEDNYVHGKVRRETRSNSGW